MSFRGSFVVGSSFQDAPLQSQSNLDYDDVPVVFDIEEDDEIQQRQVDYMLQNNDNFQGVIDPHRSAAFGFGSQRNSMTDNMLTNSRQKLSGQRRNTFNQTFGDPDGGAYESPMTNLERSTEIVATDEDFTFIQEVLQNAAAELRAKSNLPQVIPKILDMQDMNEVTSTLHTVCEEVNTQFQEFQRVIDFGGFLVDQVRRARQETEDINYVVQDKKREISDLQEREAIILNDWKHEQKCTRELETALQKRDDAYFKLEQKNMCQRITIDQMARQNERLVEEAQKQKPVTPKSTTPQQDYKKTFDFKVEKKDPRVDELEELLLQKAEELEHAENLNGVNAQRIQQTIELNEQLYYDIDMATQALTDYEVQIAELQKMNQQLVQECQRLESLVQSQPNPMIVQMMKNQGLSQLDSVSQRTYSQCQSYYGERIQSQIGADLNQDNHSQYEAGLNQSQHLNDYTDDSISRNINLPQVPQKLQTAGTIQGKEQSQFQRLANAQKVQSQRQLIQKVEQQLGIENPDQALTSQNHHEKYPSNGTLPPQQLFQQSFTNKQVPSIQIEEGVEGEYYEQFQYQEVLGGDFVQDHVHADLQMRESQLEAYEHFANQDEIQPEEIQYTEVIIDELAGLADQDGLPADHFTNFDYYKRPSNLISSRISAMPIYERPAQSQNMQSSTLTQSQTIPIKIRLKERQDQLRRVIESTDIIEGQVYFEDIRRTFCQLTNSVLIPQTGLHKPTSTSRPGTPTQKRQEAPKTSRAQNATQKQKTFDFAAPARSTAQFESQARGFPVASSKTLKVDVPIVNNTYITNHYNNFSPTQAEIVNTSPGRLVEELGSPPPQTVLLMPKKVELVDLDHYQPSIVAKSKTVPQNYFTQGEKNTASKSLTIRTSLAKLTESLLIAMPAIQEEEYGQIVGSQESLTVLQVPIRASHAAPSQKIEKTTQNIQTFDAQISLPKQPLSHASITSSDSLFKSRRSLSSRKEPEEEFFSMTLVSQIMCHPKKNLIISLQQDATKLFKLCVKNNRAFFEWPKWIANFLEVELQKIKEASLNKAQKLGAKKIQKT